MALAGAICDLELGEDVRDVVADGLDLRGGEETPKRSQDAP
jgi:hypothetical protein